MTELTDSAHWTILSSFLDTPPRMSSPLARPLPGEPRYFVKRSPGGVSPAKMMSREEAAQVVQQMARLQETQELALQDSQQ